MGQYNDMAISVRNHPADTPHYCVAAALSDCMLGLASAIRIDGGYNIQIGLEIFTGRFIRLVAGYGLFCASFV